MAKITNPEKKYLDGPWLLGQRDLEELDDLINKIDQLLLNDVELQRKEGITLSLIDSKDLSYKWTKSASLVLKDDKRVTDITVKNLLKESSLSHLKPVELLISIRYDDNAFKMKVSVQKNELKYDVACVDSGIHDEIVYELEKWIDSKSPKKTVKYWSEGAGLVGLILFIPLLIYFSDVFFTSYTDYNTVLNNDIKLLLDHGIDSTNFTKAVEMQLQLETKYTPPDFQPQVREKDPSDIRILIAICFIYLAVIFHPKTIIGIGKNQQVFILYKIWIKIVTITIPTILVVTPLWERIVKWMYGL